MNGDSRRHDLAQTIAHNLGRARDQAIELGNAHQLAFAGVINRAIDLDYALVRAHGRAFARDHHHIRARDHDRAVALDFATARAYAHALEVDLARILDHDLVRTHAVDLDLDLVRTHARDLALDLDRAWQRERARSEEGYPTRGAERLAERLAAAAAAVLARRDRARYAEEYLAELAELTATGAGWWQQLRHAARLLAAAGPLRAALAVARRRGKAA